jgi:ABC-2 type transport system permease protein
MRLFQNLYRPSWSRINAVVSKEFIQMRRDRLTLGIMIGIPIMQLILFGFAIETDPRNLPTAVQVRDNGEVSRAIVAGLKNSTFFDIELVAESEGHADELLRTGAANFVIVIPESFETNLIRGARPQILIEADATDPVATSGPGGALPMIIQSALEPVLAGALASRAQSPPAYDLIFHKRYNPAGISSHNIVPGLLAIILTMTMVMITGIAITREYERGTMEALLATPARPMEVMIGKILPYVGVGYMQVAILVIAGMGLFGVPFGNALFPLFIGASLFIVVNLALGFLISTIARNQMQAMQMAFFIFLPTVLLSGFVFPFAGMPVWAQTLGEILPGTHFLRIVRSLVLKDASLGDMLGEIWPLLLLLVVITAAAMSRYRKTLD